MLSSLKESVIEGNIEQIRSQFELGEKSGISKQELINTIQTGINKRQQATKKAVDTTNELLGIASNGYAPGSGCC